MLRIYIKQVMLKHKTYFPKLIHHKLSLDLNLTTPMKVFLSSLFDKGVHPTVPRFRNVCTSRKIQQLSSYVWTPMSKEEPFVDLLSGLLRLKWLMLSICLSDYCGTGLNSANS